MHKEIKAQTQKHAYNYRPDKTACVTLTFEIESWFVHKTHRPEHKRMRINTETASATLTFEIGAWFYRVTRRLDMVKTSAKLF